MQSFEYRRILVMDELIGRKPIFSICLQSHTNFDPSCLLQSLPPNPGMSPLNFGIYSGSPKSANTLPLLGVIFPLMIISLTLYLLQLPHYTIFEI
jgi:hypothetical protein